MIGKTLAAMSTGEQKHRKTCMNCLTSGQNPYRATCWKGPIFAFDAAEEDMSAEDLHAFLDGIKFLSPAGVGQLDELVEVMVKTVPG